MAEITVVEVKPQLVLGMRKRGRYSEIATILPHLFEFALGKGIQIRGPPIFVCHEVTPEDAMKANEEGNADIEVAIPISGKVKGNKESRAMYYRAGKWQRLFIRGRMKHAHRRIKSSLPGLKRMARE